MSKNLFFLFLFFFLGGSLFAQNMDTPTAIGLYKDPFESLLPKEPEAAVEGDQAGREDLGPPPIIIEGVLWGTDLPLALIDGEVYGVGDALETVDAKVFKIKENIVFISYGERIYEMSVQTKGVQ